MLTEKEGDSLKYGRRPQSLLLSKKKKIFATNLVLHKQLTERECKKKSLDESMLKFFENQTNTSFQKQQQLENGMKEFFRSLFNHHQQQQQQQQLQQ